MSFRPVETRGLRGGGGGVGCSPPRFLLKLTFYKLTMIDNDGEKKKGTKKDKPYQIPRKLLFILLFSM